MKNTDTKIVLLNKAKFAKKNNFFYCAAILHPLLVKVFKVSKSLKNLDIRLWEVGGKKTFKLYLKSEHTDIPTHRQTHIWTNQLIESIGPEGRCLEKEI